MSGSATTASSSHTRRFQLRITPFRASLPIYVAAQSSPSLRLTGELADGWLPIFWRRRG